MKHKREWFIPAPWGKMALKSHGDPDGDPVFLVHGRQDSCMVFEPLIEQMSDQYYYVALDMPGNGLSDAFPHGPKLMRFHFLYAMELALLHLEWDRFIFMGHSMGCEQGLFYNVVHPGQITQMILLDAGPTVMRMQVEDNAEYHKAFYDSYYEKYHWENCAKKMYTRQTATRALQRTRGLSYPQCTFLLQRNFHALEERDANELRNFNEAQNLNEAPDQNAPAPLIAELIQHMEDTDTLGYLSWDNRLKNLAPQNYGNDYYFQLFKTIPPTLLVAASEGAKNVPPNSKWRQGAKELLGKMATLDNFHRVDVEGSHDVHYTHPERVLPYINAFLKDNKVCSKL